MNSLNSGIRFSEELVICTCAETLLNVSSGWPRNRAASAKNSRGGDVRIECYAWVHGRFRRAVVVDSFVDRSGFVWSSARIFDAYPLRHYLHSGSSESVFS